MRTNIHTVDDIEVTLTVPPFNVFLKDANFLTLSVAADIKIMVGYMVLTNAVSGKTVRYRIQTNSNTYTINLNSLLESSFFDYDQTEFFASIESTLELRFVDVDNITHSLSLTEPDIFEFNMFDGFSLPNRKHGTDIAAYVGIGEDNVEMFIGNTSFIDGSLYHEGSTYYIEKGDGCYNSVTVNKLQSGGGWTEPNNADWSFGIREIVVDRCHFTEKSSIFPYLTNDFNFDSSDGDYSPISMLLRPRRERGYYDCCFVGFENDRRFMQRVSNWDYQHGGMGIVVREPEFMSLFSNEWYREAEEYYHVELGYMDDDNFVYVEDVYLIVDYDSRMAALSFTGKPLCAILFKTYDAPLWGVEQFQYNYCLHYAEKDSGNKYYAAYYLFGNHIRPKDEDSTPYLYGDFALWFNVYPESGSGLMGYFRKRVYDAGTGEDMLSCAERYTRSHAVKGTQNMYRQLYFATDSYVGEINLTSYFANTNVRYPYVVPTTINFIYSQYNDTYNTMPLWSMGIVEHTINACKVTVTLNNGLDVVLATDTGSEYQTISFFPTNYSDNRVTLVSEPILIRDIRGQHYDYDGALVASDVNCYVTICFEGYEGDFSFGMFPFYIDRVNDFIRWEEGLTCMVLKDVFGRCVIKSVDFDTLVVGVGSRHHLMPFTCNVPYVKKNEGSLLEKEKIMMFGDITVAGTTDSQSNVRQACYIRTAYETYNNLGNIINIEGEMIDESWDGVSPMRISTSSYHPLTFNNIDAYNIDDAFINLPDYIQIKNELSLSLGDFNAYKDNSFVIVNGCDPKQESSSSDLTNIQSDFSIYAFSMCDVSSSNPFVWLKYKNMDGLWRYLPMEMVDSTLKNSTQNLQFIKPNTSVINSYPYFNPYALEEKVTCVIYNVPPEMHIEDMLYSRTLTLISMDGQTEMSVILEEDSITRKFNDNEDFVLHFIKKQ